MIHKHDRTLRAIYDTKTRVNIYGYIWFKNTIEHLGLYMVQKHGRTLGAIYDTKTR